MKRKLKIRKSQLKTNLFFLLLSYFLIASLQVFGQSYSTVNYSESYDDFMNPDRGFYYPYDSEYWYAPDGYYKELDENLLRDRRTDDFTLEPQNGISAEYNINTSIILRHFVLDDFTTSDISNTFLNKIQTDFDRARNAGVRMILRFSYVLNTPLCAEDESPPPCGNVEANVCVCEYGDASEYWVKRHIDSLANYLQKNEDVIMVVQSGFIGTWGEQYYTDHFGDASANGKGFLDSDDWQARINVLKALLDAVPQSRMVQVRYPQMRYKFLQQHPQYANRIGFQNDCFLSSEDDVGTYVGYDLNDQTDPSDLQDYADEQGDNVAVGGETCGNYFNNSNDNDCEFAVPEMERMNWSFLNSAYNYEVNNKWVDESAGCIDEIKTRLGYRFVLNSGQFPDAAQKGNMVNFNLDLDNVGFAAPFNPRSLFIVLRNESNTYLPPIALNGDADTRKWKSGNNNLNLRFQLPNNIPVGDYKMYLHMADLTKDKNGNESIRNEPAYCIRLANKLSPNGPDVWNNSTGYNYLNHTISIQNIPPTQPPMGNNCIEIDGNSADWDGIVELSSANNAELSSLKVADDNDNIYIYISGTLRDHYQIFLDTDGNKVGQEYLNSDWNQTGFNYMIENGTLLRYVSDNPWNWPAIADVDQEETTNGLELTFRKNLLSNMANSNINIAANTLNASWEGTAYLPASGNYGEGYELYSSNPCVDPDVCILIDGDNSEWQNIVPTYSNTSATLKKLTIADNAQDLFLLFEGSLNLNNHTPQILFDTDNNEDGDNEFFATDWSNTGFNYMMEYDSLYRYVGDGYSWEWASIGKIERNYGFNNVLETQIPKYLFQPLNSTIKVAAYYYNSGWTAAGKLPANSSIGQNYVLGNSSSCGAVIQKTDKDDEVIVPKIKYKLKTSAPLKTEHHTNKYANNCFAADGNATEWNAMASYGYAATGSLSRIKVADNNNEILFYLEGGLDVNNQIYINSNVNNANLNRYTNSQWEYAEFNYLIENNILHVYNGDGVNWSWLQIGVVSHATSENILEIVVQKSQLSNLSSSISFAAGSLNSDYKETGAIPSSNSAFQYLLGTKDLCNIKPSCLSINGNAEEWDNINSADQNMNSANIQSVKIVDGSESLYILLEGKMDVHQQIFIDTDNDTVGNNEYTDSNWSETGYNYLIDDGDLFIYQGNGSDWNWLAIGAVNMSTSKYWLGVSVKKYLLGNIIGEIQIAASSFDLNWTETSFIPVAERGISYTPSTNNLSIFFHQNSTNFHRALQTLESSANLINSSTNETYKAGQQIHLKNGFSSPPFTDFNAYIESCE